MKLRRASLYTALWLAAGLVPATAAAAARDASFVDPGMVTNNKGSLTEALAADPKLFDAGESTIGVARRITLFFVNNGNLPLLVQDVQASGDGNVNVEVAGDDCKKNDKLAVNNRCSVVLSVMPTGAGPWSVETLVTHDGAGRLARASVKGKALNDGRGGSDGLNLASKEPRPVDFGDVEHDGEGAVRTALMVNDSAEDISLLAIDVIAAGQGLDKLEQGCALSQVLKPGESCPITLRWKPAGHGSISTDLIVRHSGKAGFTVIPIRGKSATTEGKTVESGTVKSGKAAPTTASEIADLAAKLPQVAARDLDSGDRPVKQRADRDIYFIGAVGDRAIIQRDGVTKILAAGDALEIEGAQVHLINVVGKIATVEVDGRRKYLKLAPSGFRFSSSVKEKKTNSAKNGATSSNSQSSFGKQSDNGNSSSNIAGGGK